MDTDDASSSGDEWALDDSSSGDEWALVGGVSETHIGGATAAAAAADDDDEQQQQQQQDQQPRQNTSLDGKRTGHANLFYDKSNNNNNNNDDNDEKEMERYYKEQMEKQRQELVQRLDESKEQWRRMRDAAFELAQVSMKANEERGEEPLWEAVQVLSQLGMLQECGDNNDDNDSPLPRWTSFPANTVSWPTTTAATASPATAATVADGNHNNNKKTNNGFHNDTCPAPVLEWAKFPPPSSDNGLTTGVVVPNAAHYHDDFSATTTAMTRSNGGAWTTTTAAAAVWPFTSPPSASATAAAATSTMTKTPFEEDDENDKTTRRNHFGPYDAWQLFSTKSPTHVVLGIDVTEIMNCSFQDSKVKSRTIQGVVKIKTWTLASAPFTLVLRDASQHLNSVQPNARFVETNHENDDNHAQGHHDASTAWEVLEEPDRVKDAVPNNSIDVSAMKSSHPKFRVNIPISMSYLSVLRYRCNTANLRPVPIRVQSRLQVANDNSGCCRVVLRISSNPGEGPGLGGTLTHLTVSLHLGDSFQRVCRASNPPATLDPLTGCVVWKLPRLEWGRKQRLDALLERHETTGAAPPHFSIQVTCECTHAKLSHVQVHVENVKNVLPANVSVILSQQFHLTHKELSSTHKQEKRDVQSKKTEEEVDQTKKEKLEGDCI